MKFYAIGLILAIIGGALCGIAERVNNKYDVSTTPLALVLIGAGVILWMMGLVLATL